MKHIFVAFVALLAVALVAPTADAGKKTLKIKKPKAIAAGMSWTDAGTWEFDFVITLAQQGTMPAKESRSSEARVEVLAASGDRIDKLQVTYTTLPSGDPRSTQPYLIEPGSSAPVVSAADGRTLSKEETEKVMEDHGDLVRRTPLRSWLVGKTFKKGKKVKVGNHAVLDLFGGADQFRLENLVVVFESATKKVARFRFEGTISLADKEFTGSLQAAVAGSFEVDLRRGLLVGVEAKMDIDGQIEAGGQKMSVTGGASGVRTLAYQ